MKELNTSWRAARCRLKDFFEKNKETDIFPKTNRRIKMQNKDVKKLRNLRRRKTLKKTRIFRTKCHELQHYTPTI